MRLTSARLCGTGPLMLAGAFCLALAVADTLVRPVRAQQGESPALAAMVNHPNVAEARSAICGAAGEYDRYRSQQLPQVTFGVGGNQVLTNKFKDARDGHTGTPTNTRNRSVENADESHKAIDGTITVTQQLYDWGATRSDKRIALNNKAESSITMQLQLDRIASEMIDLSLQVGEQKERVALYDAYLAEVDTIMERVRASVEAGVMRVDDLRAMNIIRVDGEAGRSLALREAGIAEGELVRRFGITYDDTVELAARFRANRPELPPVIDSNATREARLADLRIKSSGLQNDKLRAERFPRLQVSSDLKIFDIDDYNGEYEVVGRFNVAMPLYDGGSNKARRNENLWQQRGFVNSRANVIRQHRNAVSSNMQGIARSREALDANKAKETEAAERLAGARAREGITATDPVGIARAMEQLTQIRSEQITLNREVETGLLSGLFFADQLGTVLELPYGGPQC